MKDFIRRHTIDAGFFLALIAGVMLLLLWNAYR